MNKTGLIIGVIVIVILGLMFWGRENQSSTPGSDTNVASVLSATEELYDFGTISMKDGLVDYVFKITNSSAEDILVKKITTSCMCTKAYLKGISGEEKGPFGMDGMGYLPPINETIKAGESRALKVVYDPNAHGPAGVGTIDRFIYITDGAGGKLQLEIKALVTP